MFDDFTRSKRSSGFLGSIIPDAVNDVLDPAYHHVLHNAVPAGVKRLSIFMLLDSCLGMIFYMGLSRHWNYLIGI